MEISLMCNNSGTSKIHFVVVFLDMAGDLGVMVERSNSPFVFCNPGSQWSFSLTVVYKTAVGSPPADQLSNGFVVLSYVQGISERIGRILRKQQIKVTFKPLRTVNSLFPRPKAQEKVDHNLA